MPIRGGGGEEPFHAQLLISAMSASGSSYAGATRTHWLPKWLATRLRALEYYGAAATILGRDNVCVGVTHARSLRSGRGEHWCGRPAPAVLEASIPKKATEHASDC